MFLDDLYDYQFVGMPCHNGYNDKFYPQNVSYFPMIAIREILITLAMFIKFLPSMHPHLHMIFIINYLLIEKSLSL